MIFVVFFFLVGFFGGAAVIIPLLIWFIFKPDTSWKEGVQCSKCQTLQTQSGVAVALPNVCPKCGAYNMAKVSYRTIKGTQEIQPSM